MHPLNAPAIHGERKREIVSILTLLDILNTHKGHEAFCGYFVFTDQIEIA